MNERNAILARFIIEIGWAGGSGSLQYLESLQIVDMCNLKFAGLSYKRGTCFAKLLLVFYEL